MGSLTVTTKPNLKDKGWIDIPALNTDYDDWMDGAIEEVSTQFEAYIGRDFLEVSRVVELDVELNQFDFWLRHYPIVSIAEIKTRRHLGLSFSTEGIVLATNRYAFDAAKGILYTRGPQKVMGNLTLQVTYVGGLGTNQADLETNFPDIVSAANRQIAFMFKRRLDPGSFTQSIAGESTRADAELKLLKTVTETLDRHRSFTL